MTNSRKIIQNIIFTIGGEVVGKLSIIAANIHFAKNLLPHQYGTFSLTFSIVLYLSIAIEAGSALYGTRQVAILKQKQQRDFIEKLYGLRIFAGLTTATALLAFTFIIPLPAEYTGCFRLLALYLIAISCSSEWIFRGLEKFHYIFYGHVCIVFVVLLSFILVSKPSDIYLAASSISFAFLANSVCLYLILNRKLVPKLIPAGVSRDFWQLAYQSKNFWVAGFIGMAYLLVPLIGLSYFYSTEFVGIYSAFFRPIYSICGFISFIPLAIYPMMSRQFQSHFDMYTKSQFVLTILLAIFAVVTSSFLFLTGEILINRLMGEVYLEHSGIYYLLLGLIPLFAIRNRLNYSFLSIGDSYTQVKATFLALLGSLIIGLPLIFFYEIQGAVMCLLVAELIVIVVLLISTNSTKSLSLFRK